VCVGYDLRKKTQRYYETSQLPFCQLLGTPQENKKQSVYEGSHVVPRTELAKETLAWLDRYLGPVTR
jgi:hypothetical protein